jgi:hypothetical protein
VAKKVKVGDVATGETNYGDKVTGEVVTVGRMSDGRRGFQLDLGGRMVMDLGSGWSSRPWVAAETVTSVVENARRGFAAFIGGK